MLSSSPLFVGAGTVRTAGAPSLTQGAYGARGNLEIVSCDSADGLWVFWFNADEPDDPPAGADVPPGTWSAGLPFARGARYLDAQILQSVLGPDHLEVLALRADGVLESWYWSPGPGFRRRSADAAVEVASFAGAHANGTLTVTVAGRDGVARHLSSDGTDYPDRAWSAAASGPEAKSDATSSVVAAGVPAATVVPGTARAARSTRRGGSTELTWRDVDGGIRHLGLPDREGPSVS